MLSVVGEEFIAYAESVKGTYAPLIAIAKYDGSGTYREIVKEDLLRIDDDQSLPGGWLFRKTQSASSNWVRRFSLLRGEFLFFFHSPQNEKPVAIAPLEECSVVLPAQSQKSFEEVRSYRANEGFEFDIRHRTRPTVRMYALSEAERTEWVVMLRQRIDDTRRKRTGATSSAAAAADFSSENGSVSSAGLHPNFPATSSTITTANITVTSTKLTGLSLLPVKSSNSNSSSSEEKNSSRDGPVSMRFGLLDSTAAAATNTNAAIAASNGGSSSSTSGWTSAQQQQQQQQQQLATVEDDDDDDFDPLNMQEHIEQQFADDILNEFVDSSTTTTAAAAAAAVAMNRRTAGAGASVAKLQQRDFGFDVQLLERNLQRRLSDQIEARDRENAARANMLSGDALRAAQLAEERDPVTLAEMFRLSLFFADEAVAEDPQPGTPQQMPHLKGDAIEMMMMTVYRKYCGESGYMALENFIEFLDDSAILQTHVPHDANDDPLEEYVTLLDPVRLLTLVPRSIGFSTVQGYEAVTDRLIAAAEKDKFIINFSQFYLLMLRITQIVYADLYEEDATLAFNKVLLEVILPLYVWSHGRHKRGSRDVLVLEERILLLLSTYSPNLWRVFLTYAQDAVNKVPEVHLSFPDRAQLNEKGMYRLPAAAPLRMKELGRNALAATNTGSTAAAAVGNVMPESLFVTEAGCLRFARDYGITPYVVTQKQLREMLRAANRQKTIVSSRLPVRDQLLTGPMSKAQFDKSVRREKSFAPMKFGGRTNQQQQQQQQQQQKNKSTVAAAAGDDVSVVSARSNSSKRSSAQQPPLPSSPPPATDSVAAATAAVVDADAEGDIPPPLDPQQQQQQRDEEDGGELPPPPSNRSGQSFGGLSFSEFVELVARIAVVGLQQENYHIIFPTPFSKVLAMLTVWGIADLKKLEEVRIIHTDELY